MKRLMALGATVLLLGSVMTGLADEPSGDAPRDGVFLHISHGKDDPHRLLMALNMANMMAEDHDVLVYFDIAAVNVVLKDAEEIALAPFPSSKQSLDALRSRKVTLMACPTCLKVAGRSKEDLAEGVQIADKSTFFSFTTGRIVTLDY